MSQLFLSETVVITKGYGVRATTIEGQYAFAPSLCALRKFHVTDSQNTRDQIASDRKSKRTWSNCLLCISFILSGRPNECWPFSSPEPLGLISNEFKTTWPRNDRLWGRGWMLATYMRRMRNNNLEIGIAGSSCRPRENSQKETFQCLELDNLGLPIRNIGRGQLFSTLTERGKNAKQTNNFAISRGIPWTKKRI